MDLWNKLLEKHGERLFFMALAFFFCVIFIALSCISLPIKEGPVGQLAGAAITILIGLAMICFNKARGVSQSEKEKQNELV